MNNVDMMQIKILLYVKDNNNEESLYENTKRFKDVLCNYWKSQKLF